METVKFTKQMIDFQKTVFDNSFNVLTVMQTHGENVLNGLLKQFPWVTKENKKPFDDSVAFMQNAGEEYKKNVDQLFANLSELVDIKQDASEKKAKGKTDDNVSAAAADKGQLTAVTPKAKQAARG